MGDKVSGKAVSPSIRADKGFTYTKKEKSSIQASFQYDLANTVLCMYLCIHILA